MNLRDVELSITGFNGTSVGQRSKSASELKEAWLLSKVNSHKKESIDYLIAYKENEADCLRLFLYLKRGTK